MNNTTSPDARRRRLLHAALASPFVAAPMLSLWPASGAQADLYPTDVALVQQVA